MATCRDIITRALHMAKIVPLRRVPSSEEATYGMEAMRSLYDQMIDAGMFGRLNDIVATSDYVAKERERIRHPGTALITFPMTYAENGGEGSDRQPYDLSLIEAYNTTTSTRTAKLWDRNGWVDLLGLTLDSPAPLAERNRMGLSACIAVLVGDTFGDGISADIRLSASRFKGALSYKLGSDQPTRTAEYF